MLSLGINLMLQTDRLDEAQRDLAGLDRKVQEQAAKVQRAEEEVAKTTADLENLPPPPRGVNEKKADLQKQLRELDMQVTFAHHLANLVICCAHLVQLCGCYLYCSWVLTCTIPSGSNVNLKHCPYTCLLFSKYWLAECYVLFTHLHALVSKHLWCAKAGFCADKEC